QRCRVVLFSLAQSPEIEVHGEFVVEARRALAAQERLLVLIDGSPLRERVEGSGIDPSRLDERRRTWDRTLRDARVTGAHLDLGRPPAENGLTAMAEALWPPEEALEVR
ncbi:MAG: hypothetical protein ACE5GW_13885, partial [Planctomycetota bacterium]